MPLVEEDSRVQRWEHADKGQHMGYFLWEAGINFPQHQPAILEQFEAIQALKELDMTAEAKETGCWEDKRERYRGLLGDLARNYDRLKEFRYPADSFDSENSFVGFVNGNAFYAHRLLRLAPWFTFPPELASALQLIIFTLE